MFTSWVDRLFDRRMLPLRLLILLACAVGYLVQLRDPASPVRPVDWVLALTAVLVSAGGSRWPLAVVLLQSTLLGTAEPLGASLLVPIKVGASLAVFELAMYRTGWQLLVGWSVLAGVYATRVVGDMPADLAPMLYRVTVLIGLPLLLGAYLRSVRQKARQAERWLAEEHQRRLSELALARVTERTAIARDLHDMVAHHIASMVLRIGVARHVLPETDPKVREVLDDVHASGTSALADLRRLVGLLRQPSTGTGLDQPLLDPSELPDALAEVVRRSRKVGLRVDAYVDSRITGVDAVRGLAVLRLVQEGLTNVAKHAGAGARASVTVRTALDGDVRVVVCDDGGEELTEAASYGLGLGLAGLRERMEILGGRLDAGPVDRGWRLSALLPASVRSSRAVS
ncbi:sensor histidine kinase [Plantactinospora endophytica]|uniref:histidine kinase n=1 Tax=Plantactinospora endophytica TaxID=673535 RepID=A0ABQ4E9M8_9ACTN|nr:histidine kinase [Plantactinospora endophytica]GIG91434.1 two-component sensor histidine kinase [Plantactinospora endophytica]